MFFTEFADKSGSSIISVCLAGYSGVYFVREAATITMEGIHMAGVSGVGGGTLSAVQFDAQRNIQVAKLIKDATELEGDLALKFLQSAQVSGIVQNLNIQV